MSEIQTAAITLAVNTLTKKHGWEYTEVRFTTPFGAVVTIEVKDDTITANVDGIGDVLTVPLSDPKFDTKISNIEAVIATNAQYAYEYAIGVLNGPFPAGEAAIATHGYYADRYAKDVLKGPFPAGEAAIARSDECAYEYARDMLKGPFPAGEAAIAKYARLAFWYAYEVLKGPFPAGEAAIATDAKYASCYARHVLKGPFPAGEAAIARNAFYVDDLPDRYAKDVLKLPEAEAKNWRKNYLAQKGIKV